MRRGELLGLSWDDVEVDEAILRVRMALSVVRHRAERKPTKNALPRTISIDDQVVAALARQRDRQTAERAAYGPAWHSPWNLVFTQPSGRPYQPSEITKAFARLVAGLALPRLSVHGLRHTHASHLLSLKVPIKVVSHRLGHARVTETMNTYAHLLPGMDQAAVEAFSADLYGDDENDDGDRSDPATGKP